MQMQNTKKKKTDLWIKVRCVTLCACEWIKPNYASISLQSKSAVWSAPLRASAFIWLGPYGNRAYCNAELAVFP